MRASYTTNAARGMRFHGETFELEFLNAPSEKFIVLEVTYQRNGISGEGFHVIRFRRINDGLVLLGIVFEAASHVAVVDPTDLTSHWRGDNFEQHLREYVEIFDREWQP